MYKQIKKHNSWMLIAEWVQCFKDLEQFEPTQLRYKIDTLMLKCHGHDDVLQFKYYVWKHRSGYVICCFEFAFCPRFTSWISVLSTSVIFYEFDLARPLKQTKSEVYAGIQKYIDPRFSFAHQRQSL